VTDRTPEPANEGIPSDRSAAAEAALGAVPWSVGSALGLVTVAFVLALLAGAVVAETSDTGWTPVVRALTAGGVFLALYLALLGIVWGASATMGTRFADAVGLARAVGKRWYVAALGAAILAWMFSAAYTAALSSLGVKLPAEEVAVFRLLPGGSLGVGIAVLLLVVVAPLAEEVVYRGVLLTALSTRWGALAGLVVSSAVFSAVHLSLVGFVPLFVAGALFGWLFMKSRSLRVAIAAHAAYNALGLLALFATKATGVQ
jgi:membrane protease YdiL (CAAX protease family)